MKFRCMVTLVLLLCAGVARADDRLKGIMTLLIANNVTEARAKTDAAMAAYREAGDARREAICYVLLGTADMAAGDVDAARLRFGEGATRLEAAGDYFGAWFAYWVFSEHERVSGGQSDRAIAFFEKAIAMLEKAKSPSAPFSMETMMIFGGAMGMSSEVLETVGGMPEFLKPIMLQFAEVNSRDSYGAALLEIGELDKADEQLRRASEGAGLFGPLFIGSISRHIGHLRRRQWRLDEARESYRKALDYATVPLPTGVEDDGRLVREALGNLAEIEELAGRFDDALAWSDRALELARSAKDIKAEVSLLDDRAGIFIRDGRFAAAEKTHAEALVLAEKNDYVYGQALIWSSRSRMNQMRGRYGTAVADQEKALELLGTINEPYIETSFWAGLALLYMLLDSDDSAELALERARVLADRSGFCMAVASIEMMTAYRKLIRNEISPADLGRMLGEWLKVPEVRGMEGSQQIADLVRAFTGTAGPAFDTKNDVMSALGWGGATELAQMVALFRQRRFADAREMAMQGLELQPNQDLRITFLAAIGATYLIEGDDDRGLQYFERATNALDYTLDDVRVDPLLTSYLGAYRAFYFDALVQLLIKKRRFEEAFEASERARARAFLQMIGNHRIAAHDTVNTFPAQEAEALRTRIAQWQQQASMMPSRQLQDDLREGRRRYEALLTRSKASNPEYAAVTTVEPLQVGDIRGELPPDTTLLAYFVSASSRVHIWVIDRTLFEHASLPVDRAWLERATCAARQLRTGGRGVRVAEPPCEPATLDEMYERLIAPIRDKIRNRRLIIVPHGVLHYLPFAAFRDARERRHLIEDYTITYAPSASAIRFLRGKESPVNGKALVLGDPENGSPLKGAKREAMIVGTELRTAPMVGAAAKESLLYQLKGDIDLLHIAAHGSFEPDTPLFSRIALAEGDGSDGNLEVHEILSDIDLTGVNLVVLSACQTAVGKGTAGDDVVGLTRALLYAGTPGVVSTLWNIDDDAAAALMSDFYCRLLMGDSAADALRHAQLGLLRGDYPQPGQWAAFTLTGNPEGRWNASGAIRPAR